MSQTVGKICLAMAFILAGSTVISLKYLAGYLEPFTIISSGLFFSLLSLIPIYLKPLKETMRSMERQGWLMIIVQALFGLFLFRLLLLAGLRYTSAGEAGLLTGAVPAITAFLAFVVLREPLSLRSVIGIACTIAGIAALQGWQNVSYSREHFLGNCLVLGAACSESIFNVASKKSSSQPVSPMVRTTLVCLAAFPACLVLAAFETPLALLANLNIFGWLALLWQALFVTIAAYFFWFEGIRRCSTCTAAAFSGLMPLSSAVLAVIILGETLGFDKWLGGLAIIAGIIIISLKTDDTGA